MQNHSEIKEKPINLFIISETTDTIETVDKALIAFTKFDTVTFSCINKAMAKLILIVEILKVKIEGNNAFLLLNILQIGLHQINSLETITIIPAEERDDNNKNDFLVTRLRINLLKQKPNQIETGGFYQEPYSKEKINSIKCILL